MQLNDKIGKIPQNILKYVFSSDCGNLKRLKIEFGSATVNEAFAVKLFDQNHPFLRI